MITDVNIKLDDNTLPEIFYSSQIFYFSPVNLKILKKTVSFYWCCQIFSGWNINLINNLSRSYFLISLCMLKGNITELQNFQQHKNVNLMVRRSNRPIQGNVVQFRNLWCVRCNIFDSVKIREKNYQFVLRTYNSKPTL